jgi:fibronectin type 3 domain-containing protein
MHHSAVRRLAHIRVLLIAIAIVLAAPVVQAAPGATDVFIGVLGIDHFDDFTSGFSRDVVVLDTGQDRLTLEAAQIAGLPMGTRVSVRGTRVGDELLAQPGATGVTVLSDAQSATSGDTTAGGPPPDVRVAILLINFVPPPPPTPSPTPSPTPTDTPTPSDSPMPTDSPSPSDSATPTPNPTATPTPSDTPAPTPTPTPPREPWTPDYVRGVYFDNTQSVASYYADLSDGRTTITGDVFGYFTLAVDTSSCTYGVWGSAARDAAAAAGIDLSAYSNVVYAFPKQSACWWGGFSNLPGRNSWINGSMSLYVTSHELGHNFGVNHASSLTCTSGGSRVAVSNNCTRDEYGDPFDVMGYHGQRRMDNFHLWQLGYLSGADVQTVTQSGVYEVATAELAGGVPRIVRIPRDAGNWYYLEFRQPYGMFDDFSPDAAVVNGVSIRIAPGVGSLSESKLIDANPQTATFNDSALGVGQLFADDIDDIYIVTQAISSTDATVLIHLGPDVAPPAAPPDLTAGHGDTSVTLGWSPATDDVFVAGYRVARDGTNLGKVSGTTFTDSGLAQGRTYTYSVRALDESGNVSDPAQVSVYLPDTHAPSAPGSLSATETGNGGVALSWTAASDNVGVAGYDVSRDGTLLGTTDGTTFVDDAPPEGSATYSVSAYDAAGNTGPAASTSTVLPDTVAPSLTGSLQFAVSQSGRVTVSWPAGTDNVGVTGYEVWRDGTLIASPSATSFKDTDTIVTHTYSYGVVALDAAGNRSAELSGSVYVADLAAPSAPGSVTASADGADSVSVSWTAADDNVGVDHYLVYLDGTLAATTPALSAAGIHAAGGASHQLAVRAVDAAGNVGPAATAQITLAMVDTQPPSVPANLAAAAVHHRRVSLSWDASTDDQSGTITYKVFRGRKRVATVTATSFIDRTPRAKRYRYRVRAVDEAGNRSSFSVWVQVKSRR